MKILTWPFVSSEIKCWSVLICFWPVLSIWISPCNCPCRVTAEPWTREPQQDPAGAATQLWETESTLLTGARLCPTASLCRVCGSPPSQSSGNEHPDLWMTWEYNQESCVCWSSRQILPDKVRGPGTNQAIFSWVWDNHKHRNKGHWNVTVPQGSDKHWVQLYFVLFLFTYICGLQPVSWVSFGGQMAQSTHVHSDIGSHWPNSTCPSAGPREWI